MLHLDGRNSLQAQLRLSNYALYEAMSPVSSRVVTEYTGRRAIGIKLGDLCFRAHLILDAGFARTLQM